MSTPFAPEIPLSRRAGLGVLGVLAVACATVVIFAARDRALAAQLTIGLFAADLALAGLRWETGARGLALRAGAAALNLAVVAVACASLSPESPAWLLAVPVALAAPLRLMGGERGRMMMVLGLAVAVGLGLVLAGLPAAGSLPPVAAVAALAFAPSVAGPAPALRSALDESREALEAARESTRELELQLTRDSDKIVETARILTEKFERRLTNAQANRQQILNAVVDGVLTVTPAGVIESCNSAGLRLLRAREEEEVLGQPLLRFLPQARPAALALMARTSMHAAQKGAAPLSRELACIPLRGAQIEVEIAVGMMAEGSVAEDTGEFQITYTMVVRDISTRKEVERMKDQLVATVSHELRTPLTAILGSLQLMAGGAVGEFPPKARELLELAKRNGLRLVDLVNDILDIQKMQEGKMAFDMRRCSLVDICRDAVDSAAPMGESVSVAYRFDAVAGLPPVWADAGRIEQVVANLLSNATKYSPTGSTVEVRVDTAGSERLRVEVRDQGPGLEPELANKVFERFVQGETGDTRSSGGTGLGLTIARSIVERHGGEIGVVSTPGSGATFYFELPTATSVQRGNSRPEIDGSV